MPSNPEDLERRLEAFAVVAWILKDLSWVMLFPPVAWLAALVAIILESATLAMCWTADTTEMFVHRVAILMWILGNTVWMTVEFLFDTDYEKKLGRHLPWFHGPLVSNDGTSNEVLYTRGVLTVRCILMAALAPLVLLYARCLVTHLSQRPIHNPQEDDATPEDQRRLVWGLVTPEVYTCGFILPWILKDIFWVTEWFWPAWPCALIAGAIIFDCFRRFGGAIFIAELFWVLGNATWITAELFFEDMRPGARESAGFLLALGLVASLVGCREGFGRERALLDKTRPDADRAASSTSQRI